MLLLLAFLVPWVSAQQTAQGSCGDLRLEGHALDAALLRLGQRLSASIMFQHAVVASFEVAQHPRLADCDDLLQHLLEVSGLEATLVADAVIVVRTAAASRRLETEVVEVEPVVATGPLPAAAPMDQITVLGRSITGSRLLPAHLEGAAPVDVIDRQRIEQSGQQSLADLMRYLPAISGNATSTYVTNGGDGTASLTLRGLPASSTLVLLNGRRLNSDALRGQAADLNSIPLAAVERVEVLKDGASAIHGSDAIAGVVNIITRRHFRGLRLDNYLGQSSRGDLDTRHHSLLWGHEDARRSLMLGAELYQQGRILSRDRAISRSADDRERGGIDRRSSATVPARISLPEGPVILGAGLDGRSVEDYRPATAEDLYDFRTDTTAVVPNRRWSLFAEGEQEFGARATGFIEAMYSRTRARNQLAAVPLFTGFEVLDLTVAADQAFNPFGEPIQDLRRRFVELPPREQRNRTENLRLTAGLNWRLGDTDFESWLAWHETEAREHMHHVLDGPSLQRALGPAALCDGSEGCVPLDLFGPRGSLDAAMLDSVAVASEVSARSRLASFALNAHRPLFDWSGGLSELAAGIELRQEALRILPDERSQQRQIIGGTNQGPTRGEREVAEVHAEWLLPLASGAPGVESLELLLAGRASWYSDFGTTTNPKLSLRYRPVSNLLLRGTWSRGFRAPSLRQLYVAEQQSFDTLDDPCAGVVALVLQGCSQVADVTRSQFQTLTGGNADLRPERSRSHTFGLVWTPTVAGGSLRLTVDYFRIVQQDVVDSSAQFIVNQNARQGLFPDRVQRDATGNLLSVTATNLNLGRRDVRGVDLGLHWRSLPSAMGSFEIAFNAAHIDRFLDQVDPDAQSVDQAGRFRDQAAEGNGALPAWKANLGAHWHFGPWEASYDLFYVDSLDEVVPGTETERRIDAWHTHNLRLGYRLVGDLDLRLSVGVRNLLDKAPPFAASAFNDSFDARTHDLAGRFLYARVGIGIPRL